MELHRLCTGISHGGCILVPGRLSRGAQSAPDWPILPEPSVQNSKERQCGSRTMCFLEFLLAYLTSFLLFVRFKKFNLLLVHFLG